MKFSVYQASHQGGRKINEDCLGYAYTKNAVLLALADGMGGHPEGKKAADIAVRVLTQRFMEQAHTALADPLAFLQTSLFDAHWTIVDYARTHGMYDYPKTTLVAAVIQKGMLAALHSGDSRLYWVRQGRLLQRTRDHSYHDKRELLRQLPSWAHRSVLFTCLGSDALPIYDTLGPVVLHPGDRVLLCSDGLWSVMHDDDVVAGLSGVLLRNAVHSLTDDAVALGGRHGDNVSLVGLEWESAQSKQPGFDENGNETIPG